MIFNWTKEQVRALNVGDVVEYHSTKKKTQTAEIAALPSDAAGFYTVLLKIKDNTVMVGLHRCDPDKVKKVQYD